ncbi:sensor histidine kinase [Dactylosporangium darangshiense]|uniref:histidine kinase n=1 Tax=Dactylosporangium darangshiense TaxID=579108 RepID=A0ABP8CWR2_9ACTN
MQPRPPLLERLRPGQRLALESAAGLGYALAAWALFAHKISPWPLALGGTALVALPVAVGRRRPMLAFAAALGGFWLAPVAPLLGFLAVAPLAYVLYQVAGRHPVRIGLPVLAVALTGPAATALTGHAGGVLPFAVALVVAWTVGYARGEHRRYGEELVRHHAGRAEGERERARRGAAEERLRIARELHDVVAHSMSVITVQAAFGRLVVRERPDEAGAALAAIETTGRQTLDEMRRLLGVLRADGTPDPDADMTPTPTLADLERLVAQAGQAGVKVELTITGRSRRLPAGVELSAYRIVQEALTNVARHAATTSARVTLGYRPDGLTIEVADHGRGGPVASTGLGLAGMRERVQLCGGHLEAAPLPGGGFLVAAQLPTPAVDAREEPVT